MAALTAAARRSLASRLSGCHHPALSHLLTSHRSGDAATPSTPLHPASPLFRSHHSPLPHSSGTAAQTLTLFPFGIHLAGAAPSRRGFSSSPSYRVADAGAVLRDAADAAAAPNAPASFPSEVAWIAQDSSLSVAAAQHLIDAVHSFTGLNWWLSIAVSTVLLRYVLFALMLSVRKQAYVLIQETLAVKKLFDSADDEESKVEAIKRSLSLYKSLGPVVFIAILSPYTFMVLYYGILNMVEKLPSLKEGGAFWFTDLTAPDALYIFPAITALSLMIRLELSQHYSRRARSHSTNVLRMLYALSFPITASLPQSTFSNKKLFNSADDEESKVEAIKRSLSLYKSLSVFGISPVLGSVAHAISCYFATWTFATLTQTIVMNQPAMKKLLFSKLNKPRCPSSDGSVGPTAEDSSRNVDEHKHAPPERREASDSSVDQVRDQPDEKSEKGN